MSLLCPTRQRVGQVIQMVDSVRSTALAPDRVELLFYVDNDDPDLAAYQDLFQNRLTGRAKMVSGDPIGVPAAWNVLAEQCTGDLLMMANDDQRYVDYGWDARLDARVAELAEIHPDRLLCLYFDGGQYTGGGRDFPILTRRWYEALGYFTPTMFSQWEVETWVFDIADRFGRIFAVPGVFVEHLHYQDYKAPFDATYQRHRMTREKSFADHALFLRTVPEREAEVAKLRALIEDTDVDAFWFADYLAGEHERVAADVASLLERAGDSWAPITLFRDAAWTDEARRGHPVLVDVLSAVPDATLPDGSAVVAATLGAGCTATVPAEAGDGLRAFWAVLGSGRIDVDGAQVDLGEGHVAVVDAAGRADLHNPGDEPLVVVSFTVERSSAGVR